jgi:hypothetical protein
MIFQCFPNKPAHVYYFLIATSPGVSSLASSVLTARSGRRWRYSPPDSTCGANVNWSQRILRAPRHWFGEAHHGWCRGNPRTKWGIFQLAMFMYIEDHWGWGISFGLLFMLATTARRFHEITRNTFGDICSFPKMQNGGTPKSSKSLEFIRPF